MKCVSQGGEMVCMPDIGLGGTTPVGGACTEDSQCTGLVCIKQADTGWREGYCGGTCTTGKACEAGAHCTILASQQGASGGTCYKDCSSDADCTRRGYRCWDQDGDGTKECAAFASGAGVTGDACFANDDCSGDSRGKCFQPTSFPEGYCALNCVGQSCPAATHCAEIDNDRYCLDAQCCAEYTKCDIDEMESNNFPACPTDSTCSAVLALGYRGSNIGYCVSRTTSCSASLACPDGTICSKDLGGQCVYCGSADRCRDNYDCYDRDRAGGRECWPAAKGSGPPGSPCGHNRDCNGGVHGTCVPQGADGSWNGGYCLWDCADGTACPGGSACIDFSYDVGNRWVNFAYCLDRCGSNAECRSGYTCQNPNPNQTTVCFPAISGGSRP